MCVLVQRIDVGQWNRLRWRLNFLYLIVKNNNNRYTMSQREGRRGVREIGSLLRAGRQSTFSRRAEGAT